MHKQKLKVKLKEEFNARETVLNNIILELRQEMIRLQEQLSNKINECKSHEIVKVNRNFQYLLL